jgi:hypothetical protein
VATANALVDLQSFGADVLQIARSDSLDSLDRMALESRLRKLDERARGVREGLDTMFAAGLRRRAGTRIAPAPVTELAELEGFGEIDPDDASAACVFALILNLRRATTLSRPWTTADVLATDHDAQHVQPAPITTLALLEMTPAEMPKGLGVCHGCTLIFESRRKDRRACRECASRKRLPTRHSFITERELPARGKNVPIGMAEFAAGPLRWRSGYVVCCRGCGRNFTSTDGRAVQHGGACEQKYRRRAA